MSLIRMLVLIITTLCAGLVAGLLFGYSCSVNIGLRALPDIEYLHTMQSINIAIQNPAFFTCFLGAIALFPWASWICYSSRQRVPFYLMASASAVYIMGVFGVTLIGNVPLNNQLASFDIVNATPQTMKAMRIAFEGPWGTCHFIRTAFAIAAFALSILALTQINWIRNAIDAGKFTIKKP